MPESRAVVGTPHASRYLQQLCKHWAHRFETESGPTNGRIRLPLGEVRLSAAADALTIDLAVENPDDVSTMREVVVRHVDCFAFRETLRYEWA